MVIKASKITLCIGIEARVQQLGDDGALGFQAAGGDVHEQALIVLQFPLGQILRVLRGDVRKRQRLPLERGGEARLAAPGALTEDAHEREAAR